MLTDLAWSRSRPGALSVALTGIFAGAGMLVRGTLLGLALAPLSYAIWPRRTAAMRARRAFLLACHAGGFCLAPLFWAVRNATIDRTGLGFDGISQARMLLVANPVDPQSRLVTLGQLAHNAESTLKAAIYRVPEQLLPGLWIAHWQTWPGSALLGLSLSLAIAWAAWPRTVAAVPLFLTIATNAEILVAYAWGWSIRFWIPVTSLLAVLLVINWYAAIARMRPAPRRVAFCAAALAYTASLTVFAARFEAAPFVRTLGDMATLFDRTGALKVRPAAVYTPHSSLLTLCTGIPAPLTVLGRGLEPAYSHLIIGPRDETVRPEVAPPDGATLMLTVGEWRLYALPRPMRMRGFALAAR